MKYTYAYKTSDGTRHEASMDAPSREFVFESLRKQGIRAIKVVAADGSKANGEIRGIRKRVLAASVIVAVLLTAIGSAIFFHRSPSPSTFAFDSSTRRQIIGDIAIIEKGILTGWSEVFPEEGERFFASFAIPGVKAGQRNTTVEEIEKSLKRVIAPTPEDGIEARQIKAMVEGMKSEARQYVAAGGSVVEYGKRLTERQDAEIAIFERTKSEIEAAKKNLSGQKLVEFWETRNDQLRNLGVRLVPLPE